MKVALVYDDLSRLAPRPGNPADLGAEWEDERTIAGIAAALTALPAAVVRLPLDSRLIDSLQRERPDCVFNIAEGRRGRDRESVVPALCLQMGIPCTSSGAAGMGASLDKALCKMAARGLGVPTPDWALLLETGEWKTVALPFPLFVKPNGEGSSMGVRPASLVRTPEELARQAEWVLAHIGPVLVETWMPGPEYTVALLGDSSPEVLPLAEIRTDGRIYDKSMKGKDRMDEEVICPVPLPAEVARELETASRRLFAALGLSGLARFDFKCDRLGVPHFLEVNPLPGLSRYYSVFTLQARAAGYSYETLIARLVALALARAGGEDA